MRFKKYLKLQEELKIVKKSWKVKDPKGKYEVEVNDKVDKHDLIKRIEDRTNIKLNQLQSKMQSGINYLIKKEDFFKNKKNFVALKFLKSKFTMLVLFRKDTNYIRISSIFDNEMPVEHALHWTINEFNDEFKNDILCDLTKLYRYDGASINMNENDLMFIMEVNERELRKDVQIMDPNDIEILEYQY